jgi:hypothetical protein
MAIQHRLRQGLRALFAFSRTVDYALAAPYLTDEQLRLFKQMRRGEQLHSLNVLRGVLAQGDTPPDLALAALLHDVGKIRYPLRLWQKTVAVLTRAFIPALSGRLSAGDPSRWISRPFVVYAHHPAWGADLLAQTGASENALWLVAHHADNAEHWRTHDQYPLLKRLQAADDQN